jgi:hypothetical protein
MFIGESSVALRRLSPPIFERPYASRTRDRAEIHAFRDEALRRSPQLRRGRWIGVCRGLAMRSHR